jgi:chromosome segregation ATPase
MWGSSDAMWGQILVFIGTAVSALAAAWRWRKAVTRTARADALKEWQDLYQQLERDVAALRSRVEQLERERDEARAKLARQAELTEGLQRKLTSTEAKLDQALSENARLTKDNQAIQVAYEALQRRVFGGEGP